MSQRPAVRSGIRASKPVFLIWSESPKALATARAPSTSKPTAWFGSVTLAEAKYSIGEYSISTQSVSVADLIKLVGGVTETFVLAPVPVEVLLPPQAAVASATPSKTDGMTINGRFMSFSSLKAIARRHNPLPGLRPHRGRLYHDADGLARPALFGRAGARGRMGMPGDAEQPVGPLTRPATRTFFGAPAVDDLDRLDARVGFLGVPTDQGVIIPFIRSGAFAGPRLVRETRTRLRASRPDGSSAGWLDI